MRIPRVAIFLGDQLTNGTLFITSHRLVFLDSSVYGADPLAPPSPATASSDGSLVRPDAADALAQEASSLDGALPSPNQSAFAKVTRGLDLSVFAPLDKVIDAERSSERAVAHGRLCNLTVRCVDFATWRFVFESSVPDNAVAAIESRLLFAAANATRLRSAWNLYRLNEQGSAAEPLRFPLAVAEDPSFKPQQDAVSSSMFSLSAWGLGGGAKAGVPSGSLIGAGESSLSSIINAAAVELPSLTTWADAEKVGELVMPGAFDMVRELQRQKLPLKRWRVTLVNKHYQVCANYPALLAVPSKVRLLKKCYEDIL